MADFELALEKILKNEGGFILHNVEGDRGGLTYAGISYNNFPNWIGWNLINKRAKYQKSPELTTLVKDFYKVNFWDKIKGDKVRSQEVANSICDFAVNVGINKAIKLAQKVVKTKEDGIVGINTITLLNGMVTEEFLYKYALGKVKYYTNICNKSPSQKKFLLGWLNRALLDI